MNLRILKKLSKRAAPLLPLLDDRRKQFPAEKGGNYHKVFIGDRKHWERSPCHPTFEGRNEWTTKRGADIVFVTRAGRHVVMRPPAHPRKGTVMVGCVSGYYEPEWDEESAWAALENLVYGHFTDWGGEQEDAPKLTRSLGSVSDIFAAAQEIIASGGAAR